MTQPVGFVESGDCILGPEAYDLQFFKVVCALEAVRFKVFLLDDVFSLKGFGCHFRGFQYSTFPPEIHDGSIRLPMML